MSDSEIASQSPMQLVVEHGKTSELSGAERLARTVGLGEDGNYLGTQCCS